MPSRSRRNAGSSADRVSALYQRLEAAAARRSARELRQRDAERRELVRETAKQLPKGDARELLARERKLAERRERDRARRAEKAKPPGGQQPPGRPPRRPPELPPLPPEPPSEVGAVVHQPTTAAPLPEWMVNAVEAWKPQLGEGLFRDTYKVVDEGSATRFVAFVVEVDPVTGEVTVLGAVPLARNRGEAFDNADDMATLDGYQAKASAGLAIVTVPLARMA